MAMSEVVAGEGERLSGFEEPLIVGALIAGRYELLRRLSHGGMGSLWVAHDVVLDVPVAIKFIRSDVMSRSVAERLLLEAQLAARIEHPAIVRVLGLDRTAGGAPFIVMELLEGEDLRSLLDREFRLRPVQAVQMLLPIASALVAAHARGVLHRDLKPDNVFVANVHGRQQPKLVDFGIAAPLDRRRRRLTVSGAVVGSPDYLSPEQALGRDDVDERADVWGFACMLYECITGYPPFARSATENLLQDVVTQPISSFAAHGIDQPELWEIVGRALSKDREQRYPSVQALGDALARWLGERGVHEDLCGRALRSDWVPSTPPPRAAQSSETYLPTMVRPPPPVTVSRARRLPLVGALAAALFVMGACAHASSMFSTPARASHRPLQQFDSASVQRALPALRRAAPIRVEPVAPAPAPKAPRRAVTRPPGFDPVLGF